MTHADIAAASAEHKPRTLSRVERAVVALVCFCTVLGIALTAHRYTMPLMPGPYAEYVVEDVRKEESVTSGYQSVTRVIISRDGMRYAYAGRTAVKLLGMKKADLLRLEKGAKLECQELRRVGPLFAGIDRHICRLPHRAAKPGVFPGLSFWRTCQYMYCMVYCA